MPDLFTGTRAGPRAATPTPATPTPRGGVSQAEARDAGHCCRVCGAWAGFGFKNPHVQREPYRWGCAAHRDEVEAMAR